MKRIFSAFKYEYNTSLYINGKYPIVNYMKKVFAHDNVKNEIDFNEFIYFYKSLKLRNYEENDYNFKPKI